MASQSSTTSNWSKSQVEIMAKPSTKSVVWEYFGLEKGSNRQPMATDQAVCRTCRKRSSAKNGNTSNLLAYLKPHHTKIYAEATEAMKGKQPRRKTDKGIVISPRLLMLEESLERLFSSSGHIVTPLRTTLKPEKVNTLTFLANNP